MDGDQRRPLMFIHYFVASIHTGFAHEKPRGRDVPGTRRCSSYHFKRGGLGWDFCFKGCFMVMVGCA